MNTYVKQAFTSTIFLKVIALIIGLAFWSTLRDSFTGSIWLQVPVCFYNKTHVRIEAPETVWLELRGRRAHLRHLDANTIALHIDAQTLSSGPNQIEVTADHLFLPQSIIIGDIIPHNLLVTVVGGTV